MVSRRALIAAACSMPFLPIGAARANTGYFTSTERAALVTNPAFVQTLYPLYRARFIADLGPGFSAELEEHIQFAFCGIVAFDLKPYGRSTDVTMSELMDAEALDCDNYAILMWRLFDILVPVQTTNVAAIGWNGGPIGNHAQMMVQKKADANGKGGGSMLVDPTVGIVLCGYDFDGIAAGRKVSTYYMSDFYSRCGRIGTITDGFHSQVLGSLKNGLYRPSHLLYYYVDFDRFVAPVQDYADWMTPQASALLPNP